MLDLKLDRPAVTPKDAATVIIVRDGSAGLEVFCVERSKQSRFMGGALVFPGGKVDPGDASDEWLPLVTSVATERAHRIAACRETLEEAALLHATGPVSDDELLALRSRLTNDPAALREFLRSRGLKLDLAALHPFARWVTPEAESRRYDALFFVAVAPAGQTGAHDEHETMASFWATPGEVLRRWEAGDVQLAPPTHRTLWLLASCASTKAVLELAAASSKEPICPRLVQAGETLALTLPGDPEHPVREPRVAGPSRHVLRGERWMPEDAPRNA
jgi:8-oxo-dGTP pyrophosphatase MutT (NUDIX family)